MKIAQINTVDYNLFKRNLFKRAENNTMNINNECPTCRKSAPLRDLLKDTVEFSK